MYFFYLLLYLEVYGKPFKMFSILFHRKSWQKVEYYQGYGNLRQFRHLWYLRHLRYSGNISVQEICANFVKFAKFAKFAKISCTRKFAVLQYHRDFLWQKKKKIERPARCPISLSISGTNTHFVRFKGWSMMFYLSHWNVHRERLSQIRQGCTQHYKLHLTYL